MSEMSREELEWYAESLERDCRQMRRYIDECLEVDQVLRPDYHMAEDEEAEWNAMGWTYDGFGTWASPGYQIVRPGKIQPNEYDWYEEAS